MAKTMMIPENALWIVLLIVVLIINTLIRGYFREKRLEYVQQHTDSKTFSQYLMYSQIAGFISLFIIGGVIVYFMVYTKK